MDENAATSSSSCSSLGQSAASGAAVDGKNQAISTSKRVALAEIDRNLATPSNNTFSFRGEMSSNGKSNSVLRLVSALTKAAQEVETPKPWSAYDFQSAPRTSRQTSSFLATNSSSIKPPVSVATAAPTTTARKQTTTSSHLKSTRKSDLYERLWESEKETFKAKLRVHVMEIADLQRENRELRALLRQRQQKEKREGAGLREEDGSTAQNSPQDEGEDQGTEPIEENEEMGGEFEFHSTQSSERTKEAIAELSNRLTELQNEAEKRLIAAATQVDQYRSQLSQRTEELGAANQQIEQLKSQLSTTANAAASVQSHGANSEMKAGNSQSLQQQFDKLHKQFQETSQQNQEMKHTMLKAVNKLKEMMQEVANKSMEIEVLKKEKSEVELKYQNLQQQQQQQQQTLLLARQMETSQETSQENHSNLLNNLNNYHQQHQFILLKQAFCKLFEKCTESNIEVSHLGRLICSILEVNSQEEARILENIRTMSTAMTVTSTLSSIASIFE